MTQLSYIVKKSHHASYLLHASSYSFHSPLSFVSFRETARNFPIMPDYKTENEKFHEIIQTDYFIEKTKCIYKI